jgi:hypothetical protein
MKKHILLLIGVAIVVIAFSACANNGIGHSATDSTAVVYTCKMHPEVISDKPGKCPKCGMDLLKKEDLKKDSIRQGRKTDGAK